MKNSRFAYNPYNDIFIDCGDTHTSAIYNKGYQKEYDNFIRGIIYNDILYLRLYYPFDDMNIKTWTDIQKASKILLQDNINRIVKLIKSTYGTCPVNIQYNTDNDLLQREGLTVI